MRGADPWSLTVRTGIRKPRRCSGALEALRLAKLRVQADGPAARSPWYSRQFAAAGFESVATHDARRHAPDAIADS